MAVSEQKVIVTGINAHFEIELMRREWIVDHDLFSVQPTRNRIYLTNNRVNFEFISRFPGRYHIKFVGGDDIRTFTVISITNIDKFNSKSLERLAQFSEFDKPHVFLLMPEFLTEQQVIELSILGCAPINVSGKLYRGQMYAKDIPFLSDLDFVWNIGIMQKVW